MSAIEDTRKVFQDFLAPELREISTRLTALETRYDLPDQKIDGVDRRAEKRHEDAERRSERRHDEVMGAIRQVIDLTSIQERLARLESKEAAHQ